MSTLFGSTPKVQPVARMPDMQDPAIKEAQAAKLRDIAARSGRRSTVLNQPNGSGGAASYGNSLLGQS